MPLREQPAENYERDDDRGFEDDDADISGPGHVDEV
jgi:hypothetical protein